MTTIPTIPNVNAGGSLDIIQTTFKLSAISNAATWNNGNATQLQSDLLALVEENLGANSPLKSYIGSWDLVWGPCVFQNVGSTDADNAMYVAYNADIDYYVVAIAATNIQSLYDWETEDFNVGLANRVAFPNGISAPNCVNPSSATNVGLVSLGTATGVTHLLSMSPPSENVPGYGQNLQQFLKSKESTSATLVFTGHSLGGALSPTLAFWLYPQGSNNGQPWANVFVLPTAGATPGDLDFATAFNTAFPQTAVTGTNATTYDYAYWNTVIWNQYDTVPHAWCNLSWASPGQAPGNVIWDLVLGTTILNTTYVKSCTCLYGPLSGLALQEIPFLIGKANQAAGNVITNDVVSSSYAHLQNQMLPAPQPSPPPGGVSTIQQFLNYLGQQHMTEYATLFDVPPDPFNANVNWGEALWNVLGTLIEDLLKDLTVTIDTVPAAGAPAPTDA